MQQRLSTIEQRILVGAVNDLLHLRRRTTAIPECASTATAFGLKEAVHLARNEGLVSLDVARWLGHPLASAAERMMASRAYSRLERRGLVERSATYGTKTMHLRPTDAGIKLAKQLEAAASGA